MAAPTKPSAPPRTPSTRPAPPSSASRAASIDHRPAMPGRAPMLPHPAAVRGVVFINKDQCKGCDLCIEFCPKTVLARSQAYNAKGYHYPVVTKAECINCRLCVTVCPEYAIFSLAAANRVKGASAAAAMTPGGHA